MSFEREVEAMAMERPGWDEYFLGIARAVSVRGDCRRSRVGAVIVNWENRVISTGYNGTLPGVDGCLRGKCPRGLKSFDEVLPYAPYVDCIAEHAEKNAIDFLDSGEGLQFPPGLTMYVTREPCEMCAELVRYFGISKVVVG